jgi:hypothetical protein
MKLITTSIIIILELILVKVHTNVCVLWFFAEVISHLHFHCANEMCTFCMFKFSMLCYVTDWDWFLCMLMWYLTCLSMQGASTVVSWEHMWRELDIGCPQTELILLDPSDGCLLAVHFRIEPFSFHNVVFFFHQFKGWIKPKNQIIL